MLDLQTILTTTPIYMAAGELILYADGVHLTIGRVSGDVITLTDEGHSYFTALAEPAAAAESEEVSAVIAEARAAAAAEATAEAPPVVEAAPVVEAEPVVEAAPVVDQAGFGAA